MRLAQPFVVTVSFSVAIACGGKSNSEIEEAQPGRHGGYANPPPCSLTGDAQPCDDGSRRHTPDAAIPDASVVNAEPILCDFPMCPPDSPIPGTDCGACPTPIGIECTYGKPACPTRATCEPNGMWQVGASICDASVAD